MSAMDDWPWVYCAKCGMDVVLDAEGFHQRRGDAHTLIKTTRPPSGIIATILRKDLATMRQIAQGQPSSHV